jgi:nucleoid DNA-binding protein
MANGNKKAPSKSEVFREISEKAELPRKQVRAVFDELNSLVAKNLKKNGPQQFTIPGLCKIVVKRIPAKPARTGVPNPFKPGELMDVPAKPARNVVKVRPLKALKQMV